MPIRQNRRITYGILPNEVVESTMVNEDSLISDQSFQNIFNIDVGKIAKSHRMCSSAFKVNSTCSEQAYLYTLWQPLHKLWD